jgi:histidinol-phosphate/aromatic aminotransferase/cobyric acid decarboxylase-like protein
MSNPLTSIKTRVRELRPYSLRPDMGRVKLNQNESPWDTPVKIKQETLRRISDCTWSRYPSFAPRR